MSKVPDNFEATDLYATGSLRCAGAASVSGNATIKGTSALVGAVTVTGAANLTGGAAVTGNVATSGCISFGANKPSISVGTAAPTAVAWPGSLYLRYNLTGSGSDVTNATMYLNNSASGASGSTWSLLEALDLA